MSKTEASKVIKELVDKHESSLEKIAARFGVHHRTVERWARGETEPNRVELEKLQQILRGYESRN